MKKLAFLAAWPILMLQMDMRGSGKSFDRRRYIVMLFSKTFIPTARDAQKNITDPSVARLSRAGYIAADQETRTLRLLPLGFLLWERVISDALDLAREEGIQVAGFEDVPEDAMTVSKSL